MTGNFCYMITKRLNVGTDWSTFGINAISTICLPIVKGLVNPKQAEPIVSSTTKKIDDEREKEADTTTVQESV